METSRVGEVNTTRDELFSSLEKPKEGLDVKKAGVGKYCCGPLTVDGSDSGVFVDRRVDEEELFTVDHIALQLVGHDVVDAKDVTIDTLTVFVEDDALNEITYGLAHLACSTYKEEMKVPTPHMPCFVYLPALAQL
ncbi:hypothetical protein NDU88_003332 [Pleurodeles waltl]|uniref:Uncharacterized protein n=1 Tax=Pleurodeles waltl TaxID=8319 RepID=A0AAV7NHX1_PLEWA|nr:hypothetical protein NDU88_003332 [Pleurodeles waltl]